MKIAVLFDGAGLARLGLEQAGHDCTGYEIDPHKHALSLHVGSGNSILADVRDVDLSGYDAVWASPPCQAHSEARINNVNARNDGDLLAWSLALPHEVLWVENVMNSKVTAWGTRYNAAQFLEHPVQRRRRMIGGRYRAPKVYRTYQADYPSMRSSVPPACMATEIAHGGYHQDVTKERRKFTKWYRIRQERYPTVDDMAAAQGFTIPDAWRVAPNGFTEKQWLRNIAEGLGNGVPVYMARAFGEAYNE